MGFSSVFDPALRCLQLGNERPHANCASIGSCSSSARAHSLHQLLQSLAPLLLHQPELGKYQAVGERIGRPWTPPTGKPEHRLELWCSRAWSCQPMLRSVALLEERNG